MSGFSRISQLPNGVTTELIRVDGKDSIHSLMLDEKLLSVVANEAIAHDTTMDSSRFETVLDAVRDGKIQAYFMIVSWENCRRKFGGGAIEFPTLLTEWNGQQMLYYPATLNEDTYVPQDISEKLRVQTKLSADDKGVGLGTHLMYERIKIATDLAAGTGPFQMISAGRIAEFSAHSRMGGLLTKLGARLGTTDSPILELNQLKPELKRGWDVEVATHALGTAEGGAEIPNVFVTSWSSADGQQIISASFTDAISTFLGAPIVRVQFTGNGNLPDTDTLKDVLSGLVLAGYSEILSPERNWASANFDKSGLGEAKIKMRMHMHDPAIAAALQEIGAQTRLLGPHLMLPALTNYASMPKSIVGFEVPKAAPLVIVRTARFSAGARPAGAEFIQKIDSRQTGALVA